VTERAQGFDDDTMKFGLLMESAQAHQKLAETHLQRLTAHTQDLDDVVRDEIRRTLVEELQTLTTETANAADALRQMNRAAHLRGLAWNGVIALVCTFLPLIVTHWFLPTASTVERLRTERDALAENIERLHRRGGNVEWRSCGETARLCVQIDRKAPVYGSGGDYYIAKGY